MPLLKGSSDDIIAENVREMRKAGHSEAQAVAASLKTAKRFTNMKQPKGKSSEVASTKSLTEDYPYGLRLDLNDDSLNKLKMPNLPKVGDQLHFHVKGKVENVSSHQHSDDKNAQRSVGLQITHMKHVPTPGVGSE